MVKAVKEITKRMVMYEPNPKPHLKLDVGVLNTNIVVRSCQIQKRRWWQFELFHYFESCSYGHGFDIAVKICGLGIEWMTQTKPKRSEGFWRNHSHCRNLLAL